MNLRYFEEFDGLRAIAVISVVLFHASSTLVGGGYVGVDVFFVISGFLITRLLVDEIQREGKLDYVAFLARRMRRLLPHAFIVLVFCIGIGLLVTPRYRWGDHGYDIIAATFNFSNYHFALKAVDYFTHNDKPSVVLHFWSLSVEEQFYLVWPLLIVATWRLFRKNFTQTMMIVVLVLMSVSFAIGMNYLAADQKRAFFFTEARLWQLASGGLTYFISIRLPRLPAVAAIASKQFGFLGIVVAAIIFDEAMDYPGTASLLPTLSSAAVLLGIVSNGSGQRSAPWWDVAAHGLRHPIMRWIGIRSYGWYLWHWPLILVARTYWPDQSAYALGAALLGLLASAIVFRWVENPLRLQQILVLRPGTALLSAFSLAVGIAAISMTLPLLAKTGPGAAPRIAAELEQARADLGQNLHDKCHLPVQEVEQPACVYGAVDGAKKVVLFGDSHAAQWFAGLEVAARTAGWQLRSWTKSSCPSADVTVFFAPRRQPFAECDLWREQIMDRLRGAEKPDLVVISNMTDYAGWIWHREEKTVLGRVRAGAAMQAGLARTVAKLTSIGIPVVLIRDTPRMYVTYADCLLRGSEASCDRPRQEALHTSARDIEAAASLSPLVSVLDLSDRLCSQHVCSVRLNGQIIYRDDQHVTSRFASSQADVFLQMLRNR